MMPTHETPRRMPNERRTKLDRLHTRQLVDELFEDDLHVKRARSLANAVTGVLRAAALSVHAIGEAYSEVAGTKSRFGVKQVDRFLSNRAIDDCKAQLVVGDLDACEWADGEVLAGDLPDVSEARGGVSGGGRAATEEEV